MARRRAGSPRSSPERCEPIGGPIRVGIVQRVVPAYRRPFFDGLARRDDLDVTVVAGEPGPDEELRPAEELEAAHRVRVGNAETPGGGLRWQSGVLPWLRRTQPDVLVVEANPRTVTNWAAAAWARLHDRPILGWGLGELPREGPAPLRRLRASAWTTFVGRLDGAVGYSSKACRDYRDAGLPDDRVFRALNATDTSASRRLREEVQPADAWRAGWLEDRGLDPDVPTVVFVGRLIPEKRLDLLLEASEQVAESHQILVVGDGPARQDLEALAEEVDAPVRFLGYQTEEDLARAFVASDLFLLPGAGGLALHEAMAYGLPVVAAFGDGTEADLVRDGENGLLIPEPSARAYAEAMTELLEDPDRLASMGKRSLQIVEDEASMDHMIASFADAVQAAHRGFP